MRVMIVNPHEVLFDGQAHSIVMPGEMGVFEVLRISRTIQESLVSRTTMTEVRRVAESEGFQMLAYDGLQKAVAGITSHRELIRNVSIQSLDDFLRTRDSQATPDLYNRT